MPPPKGRRFEFMAVESRFQKLFDELPGLKFAGDKLDKELFRDFADMTKRVLFSSKASASSIDEAFSSDPSADPEGIIDFTDTLVPETERELDIFLSQYLGRELDFESLISICWRIAAGIKHMELGHRLKPDFNSGTFLDWAALRFENVRFAPRSKKGALVLEAEFRVFDGPYAGLTFRQRMPQDTVLKYVAWNIGFPRFKRVPHRNELALFYVCGLLDVSNETVRIRETHATSTCLNYNRSIRNRRTLPRTKEPCKFGFEYACQICNVGHRQFGSGVDGAIKVEQQCARATHSHTFVQKMCNGCNNAEAFFDPGANTSLCIYCYKNKCHGKPVEPVTVQPSGEPR